MRFKEFVNIKKSLITETANKDWSKSFIQLDKGFVPPSNLGIIIDAFMKSGEVVIFKDTTKDVTMPKKSLFLVGGPVRDFLLGKTIKDFDLATNATPEQVAAILNHSGFKMTEERSGKGGLPLALTFEPALARHGDKRTWFIKGRDNSNERKVFVISAVVNNEEFEIATFRQDKIVVDGQAEVDFVDNPVEDAKRRDLTINSLYIELTKSNGENSKLYDPTTRGWHDVKNGIVRTVGRAEDRFQEDPLRVLRALRFHARFSNSDELDPEINAAIQKFKNLDGVALERIRDEFLKGLMNKDVNINNYIKLYHKTGLFNVVFPGLKLTNIDGKLAEFKERLDKPLALAWLLKNNSINDIFNVLSSGRWTIEEKRAIIFLLEIINFKPQNLDYFYKLRMGTGLSNEQIEKWMEINNIKNENIKRFINYKKTVKWEDVIAKSLDICNNCKGFGCSECENSGHVLPRQRSALINRLEIQKFIGDNSFL